MGSEMMKTWSVRVMKAFGRMGGMLCVLASISMSANMRAADYSVTLEPDTAKRKVVALHGVPASVTLCLTPETPWKIGASSISAQDTFLWSGPSGYTYGSSPQPYVHTYRALNVSSSREYVKIHGKLVQDGEGCGTSPGFLVTVPSVDIDWDEFSAPSDEAGEDNRNVPCPVTDNMNKRRKLVIRNPYPKDDIGLIGSSPDMILTLTSGFADCFRLMRADGTPFTLGTIALNSVSSWPLELYVDAISGRPACELGIELQGPTGPGGGRAKDKICGTTKISLTLDDPIWWFNGADPGGGYHVQSTLRANAPDTGQFVWRVVAGNGKIKLNNGGADADMITAVDDNTVTVKSTGASSAIDDVVIALAYNGTAEEQCKLTVRKPGSPRLISGYPSDGAIGIGFKTKYLCQLLDQFGADVPFDMPINESFGGWISDWAFEVWTEPQPNGMLTTTINGFPHAFADTYSLALGIPLPVNPTDTPAADSKVQHAIQYYRAGSTTVGQGILFKQHTLQFYRGKARQE